MILPQMNSTAKRNLRRSVPESPIFAKKAFTCMNSPGLSSDEDDGFSVRNTYATSPSAIRATITERYKNAANIKELEEKAIVK